ELRKAQNIAFLYAADEMAIAMGGNKGLTIEEKGAKEVPVLSTGHEKTNVTLMLTAASDGTPLKPTLV
ncbi:pogo transposable element with KRAB domain-like protein, partial [Aphelenchoides avenae]